MKTRFNLTPNLKHQTIIVDALGRVNRLQEALNFIKAEIPNPSFVVWTSLLGAARLHVCKVSLISIGCHLQSYPFTFILEKLKSRAISC